MSTIHLHRTTTSTPERRQARLEDGQKTIKAIEARNSDSVEGSIQMPARRTS